MKILTYNSPKSILEEMDILIKEKEILSSRSEFIRIAVHHYLMKKLKEFRQNQNRSKETVIMEDSKDVVINIPMDDGTQKTYRIVKK